MTTIFSGILMLGVLVFVHELGHFVVAKLCGVKVLKFSLGFGPRLASKHWGETEYLISAIPLGGYVQMLGEGSGEQGESADLTEDDKQRSFAEKSVSRRLAIVSAGPLMNLVLPFLILPISYMTGVMMPAYIDRAPCVGYVVEKSDAAQSGFKIGDCVLSVNQQPVDSWNDTNRVFVGAAGDPLYFDVKRGDQQLRLVIPADNNSLEGMQALGLLPNQDAHVGGVADDMPAQQAGIQKGDQILRIADYPIRSWYDLRSTIQLTGGKPISIVVQRDQQQLTFDLTPVQKNGEGDFLIGIAPREEVVEKSYGFADSIVEGGKRTWELIDLTVVFVHKLITGSVSAKNIGGPITVVQVAGQAAQTDLSAILSVLAFISIQLGILNLLPIPILDGGHIMFSLVEMLMKRPLSFRVREMSQQIGMVLLLMLMALAFYNDIVRLWG